MLSQKVFIWMAKQKAPNAGRMIVSVETLHATPLVVSFATP